MDTKDLILEKALELFALRGFGAVGIQEIVDVCGITKPTLYHHFGSKNGLLAQILETKSRPLIDSLTAAASYHHDITKNLTDLVAVFLDFAAGEPSFYRFILSLSFLPRENEIFPLVESFYQKIYSPVETMFLMAEDDHGNMRGRSRNYALTFVGMIHSYIHSAILTQTIEKAPDLGYKAVHQFMHGIFS